ncbi:MAG: hypothetical protein AAF481_04455 [Acidobacteriota bacterium]
MKRFLSLGLVLAVALALSASASTFVAQSQDDLLRESTAVVEGTVLTVDSFWNETNQIIVTEAQVQIDDEILGKADSIVTVRTYGGEVDGFRVEAHGFPTFEPDQKVLMFLQPDDHGTHKVTGYQQGLYRVVENDAGVAMAIPAVELETNLVTLDGLKASLPAAQNLDELKTSILDDAADAGLIHR